MYSQIENELKKRDDLYSDYEEYTYILEADLENTIRYLFANLDTLSRDELEEGIRNCEIYISCLKKEEISSFFIECNLLLLDVLKLFGLNKLKNEMAEHIFQCKLGNVIESEEFDRDIFEKALLLIFTVIPNLRSVLYYYQINVYVNDTIMFGECQKYIMQGKYILAYEQCKIILKNLFENEKKYFEVIEGKEEIHRKWIKKKFDVCLKMASVVNKIDDLQKYVNNLCKSNMKSICEKDKKEFYIKCDVEKLCCNHIKRLEKGGDKSIIRFFENCRLEEDISNIEYICNIKHMYQRVLSKIIEEDSARSEDEYNKLNRKVISLCDEIIKLIRTPRNWNSLSRLSSQFEEKRLLSKIWIWNSYTREIKESIVEEIFVYEGTNPIINNISQIVKLYKNMGENKELNNVYILFGEFIDLMKEVMYLEKELFVWDCNREYTYYTTMKTLSFLLLDENEKIKEKRNRLSLMNSDYMNDPNEGNVFYDIYREMYRHKHSLKTYERLVNESSKKRRKNYNSSLVFLKSFSSKVDKLTMWSEYGDKGKGCCVVVDGNTFKNVKTKLELLYNRSIEEHVDNNDEYGLYNILYWDSKNNVYILNGQKNDTAKQYMENIIRHIGQICVYAETISTEDTWLEGIVDGIRNVVMKISYLIKYEEYQDEEESRLILVRNAYGKNNDIETIINSDEVLKSMLFIHYPLKTQINEIILGPKMIEADFYAPYILKKIKGMNGENQSTTKLSISSIDYR